MTPAALRALDGCLAALASQVQDARDLLAAALADPPPCPTLPAGGPLPPPDAPEPVRSAQGALPGFEPPAKVRRATNHRFGLLTHVTVPATDLAPEHLAAVETCPHCGTQRKRDNVGKRLGSKWQFSVDGKAWSRESPLCVVKR